MIVNRANRSRRRGRWFAALAVVVLALTGCATDDGVSKDGVVTVKFLSLAYQPTTVKAVKRIVDSFNAAHPKIKVDLIQGSFDTINQQLVTSFQGETAPDVFHAQASLIYNFESQGYLADIGKYLDKDYVDNVPRGVLDSVTDDGKVFAAPTLLQSYVVFANLDLLQRNGIDVPTGTTLSWDDFRSMANKATTGGVSGVGWGLKQPVATVMNLSLGFDGTYFSGSGIDAKIHVGDDELEVPRRMHQMIHDDKSLSAVSVTQSGADTLPGFYAGKYAMVVGGDFIAQSIVSQAPKSFRWAVLPPLAGDTAHQASDPQSLSISEQSKHKQQAAEFLNYYTNATNLASLAEGDWLIPASSTASTVLEQRTGGKNGWDQILPTAQQLVDAPFSRQDLYPQWKTEVAQPALQQYLADKISLKELRKQLTDGWAS